MKKLFYGLGSVAAIAAPVAAVVSCGSDDESTSSVFSASQTGTKLTITVSGKGTTSQLSAELSKIDAKQLESATTLVLVSKANSKVTQELDLVKELQNANPTAEKIVGLLGASSSLNHAFAGCFTLA